jgi:cytochrome c
MRIRPIWLLVSVLAFMAAVGLGAQSTSISVTDGVYTTAQAQRGKATYEVFCAGCHATDLLGTNSGDSGAPPLKREGFMSGSNAGALFTKIRRTMPEDAPGSVPAPDVVDVIAYLFEANRFPAGRTELPVAAAELERIQIVDGPLLSGDR